VVKNEKNELIPTRIQNSWRVCIDYRRLNQATRKDHFPLPFMDQMLDRLKGKSHYCFLDGLHPHNSMTHTKTSITIIPHYSNILILAYPIHHLCYFIPSTPIPMTPNFNQMHSFLHQAPTDPQHPLNHEKHSLYIVTNVAWRREAGRQAVHQFWNFPDSCTTPTRFQNLVHFLQFHNPNVP